jgi:hypothetical protein
VLGRDSFIRVPALIASWNVSQALKHHEPPLPRETNVLICSFRSAWTSVITLKPAIRDRVKSGHRERQKTSLFYLAGVQICKAESGALMIRPFGCVLVL